MTFFFLTYIESQSKISLKGKNCFNLRELGVASKRTDPQCRIVVSNLDLVVLFSSKTTPRVLLKFKLLNYSCMLRVKF